ncbi:hypothetical protein D3C83_310660 [compost metagenome]
MFTIVVRMMMPTIVSCPGRPRAWSVAAPFSANSAPRFDWPNAAMNSDTKKASTM